jgi:hypothetical protein
MLEYLCTNLSPPPAAASPQGRKVKCVPRSPDYLSGAATSDAWALVLAARDAAAAHLAKMSHIATLAARKI